MYFLRGASQHFYTPFVVLCLNFCFMLLIPPEANNPELFNCDVSIFTSKVGRVSPIDALF